MNLLENKELLKTIFIEEAFNASAAKVFGTNKQSYHYKNLETAFEKFYERIQINNNNKEQK